MRNLVVLVIQDFGSDSLAEEHLQLHSENFGECVDVRLVHSFRSAEEMVISGVCKADVLLLDVMGEADKTVRGEPSRWPLVDKHDLRPFLAILALPFICMRPVISLIPFSSFWPYLLRDPEPMVWVALGLLVSKLKRKPVAWTELGKEIAAINHYQSADTAIGPGVQAFRERLYDELMAPEPIVTLLPGMAAILVELARFRDSPDVGGRGRFPLRKLALRLQWENETDSIWIESLFGDVLDFCRGPVIAQQYDAVTKWIAGFELLEKEYELAVAVLKCIREMDPRPKAGLAMEAVVERFGRANSGPVQPSLIGNEDHPTRRNKLDKALDRVLGSSDSQTRFTIKQLVVTLAQVVGAHQAKGDGETMRKGVHKALGISEDHTYNGIFEPRGNPRPGRKAPLWKYLPPFDADAESKVKKFFLHTDSPPLKLGVKALCQEYARSELRWDGVRCDEKNNTWPRWMR